MNLVVDNFAGGGGASLGIETALGRPVDFAINHDSEAIAMHRANHPRTQHLIMSVWDVNPAKLCAGRPVDLGWFSPDCTFHSKARGMLPVTFMLLQPPSWHPDVWTDVTRMLTLNGAQSAKGREMHVAPLQFDIVDRAIEQLSMPGETVFDPFNGIGTTVYRAILKKRRGIGIELNSRYFLDACSYCKAAEQEVSMPDLFASLEPGTSEVAA